MSAPISRLWRSFGLTSKISNYSKIIREGWTSKHHKFNPLKKSSCRNVRAGVLFSVGTVNCLGWGKVPEQDHSKSSQTAAGKVDPTLVIIQRADDLYDKNEMLKLYEFLRPHADCDNDEILWRLSRAACDKGKMSSDAEVKKACIYEAFGYIKRAIELNKENFACHKWYAILLDYTGEYEGTRKRIENAYLVKKHFLKAIELNPKDATSIHSLGFWCFTFADLPWYAKKIASAVFATPPTSTYEEALKYFELAEKVDPDFYSMNLLMLGKTLVRMKQTDKAKEYLFRARSFPVRTPDDKKAHEEAIQLLKGLGIKE